MHFLNFLFLCNFGTLMHSVLPCVPQKYYVCLRSHSKATNKPTVAMLSKMSPAIRLALAILVINLLVSPCTGLRGIGNRSTGVGKNKGYKDPGKPKTLAGTSSGLPAQNTTRRGLGISAWGIVSLIVTLMLAGMGFYYFQMCYPILCKKTRKYDMMGLPSTGSVAV